MRIAVVENTTGFEDVVHPIFRDTSTYWSSTIWQPSEMASSALVDSGIMQSASLKRSSTAPVQLSVVLYHSHAIVISIKVINRTLLNQTFNKLVLVSTIFVNKASIDSKSVHDPIRFTIVSIVAGHREPASRRVLGG